MKQQMTMGKKLFGSFGALLALTVCTGVYSSISIRSINASVNKLATVNARQQFLVGDLSTRAEELSAQAEAIVLAAAGDKTALDGLNEQLSKSIDVLGKDIATIHPLVESAQGRQYLNEIQKSLEPLSAAAPQLVQLAKDGKATEAADAYKNSFASALAKMRVATDGMQQLQLDLIRTTSASASAAATRGQWTMALALLFAALVSALVVWVIHDIHVALRRFVADLNNNSEQVAAASGQIAATSQSLSQGSSEQAASLEELSASMEEMTAMSKRNTENSGQMTGMMVETAAQVDRSNNALHEMVDSMAAIKSSSEKVAKIIKTIDEIAFQTNILALNAAVEAARAGEAGMGVAVVADEVRNLAQRAAVAAKDTAGLIEEAIASSNQGAQKLEQVEVAIRAITESAGKVKNLAEEVSESSKQQTQGIEQASTALTQVSKVTQSAAASAEESAAASEELSAQAQSMRKAVQSLQVMVGGEANTARKTTTVKAVNKAKAKTPASAPVQRATKPMPAATAVKHTPVAVPAEHDPFPMDAVEVGDFKSF